MFRVNITHPKRPGSFSGEILIHSSLGKVGGIGLRTCTGTLALVVHSSFVSVCCSLALCRHVYNVMAAYVVIVVYECCWCVFVCVCVQTLPVPVNYKAVTGNIQTMPSWIKFDPVFPVSSVRERERARERTNPVIFRVNESLLIATFLSAVLHVLHSAQDTEHIYPACAGPIPGRRPSRQSHRFWLSQGQGRRRVRGTRGWVWPTTPTSGASLRLSCPQTQHDYYRECWDVDE